MTERDQLVKLSAQLAKHGKQNHRFIRRMLNGRGSVQDPGLSRDLLSAVNAAGDLDHLIGSLLWQIKAQIAHLDKPLDQRLRELETNHEPVDYANILKKIVETDGLKKAAASREASAPVAV